MNYPFEQALDACLVQLNKGEDLEAALAAFPECADELRPALAASEWMQRLAPPPERKHVSKYAFVAAVAERRRLVECVDGLVVEVKVGVPVTELLSRTAAPLQGVVYAAHAMQADVVPMPSIESIDRGKAEFMVRVAQHRLARGRVNASASTPVPSALGTNGQGAWRMLLGGLQPMPRLARRMVTSAIALSVAGAVAMTGVAQVGSAAASSLPGDPLYQVKILGQNARMMFMFDPEARSDLQAEYARRRLADIESLVASGRNVPAEAIELLLSEKASLDGLSTVQRAMLGGLVRSMTRSDAGLAERLRRSAGDPNDVDALMREGIVEQDVVIPNRKPAEVPLPADDLAPAAIEVTGQSQRAKPVAAPEKPLATEAPSQGPQTTAPNTGSGPSVNPSDPSTGGERGSGTAADAPEGPAIDPPAGEPEQPEPALPPNLQPNLDPAPEPAGDAPAP